MVKKNPSVFLFFSLFKLIHCLELLTLRDSPHYKASSEGVTDWVLCKHLWLCLPQEEERSFTEKEGQE